MSRNSAWKADAAIEAVNDLWFEWSEREGRGSSEYTLAVVDNVLSQPWLLDLARGFGPKVIRLDVTPEGTYQESTTRWGMNPVYEAIPAKVRDRVEAELPTDVSAYYARLRAEQA